jgi:hypothetical protein
MKILYSPGYRLGFETFVAPANFDRSAHPVDIYEVFKQYHRNHPTAKYIYSVPDNFAQYGDMASQEQPLWSDGTSFTLGYEVGGTKYTEDLPITTFVGTYPDGNYTSIEVVSTAGFPATGRVTLGNLYAIQYYNGTAYKTNFIYTSKDATHFYGVSQRIRGDLGANVVCPTYNWTGKTKRYVIVHNTNNDMQSAYLGNWIKCEWLYLGDKINHIQCGSGSIGSSSVKWIHIHRLDQITTYGYCDFYQSNIYGELHLSRNAACTQIGNYIPNNYDYGTTFVNNTNLTGTLTIPSNIVGISSQSFQGTGFTSIIFEEGLKYIRGNAFYNMQKVSSISALPNTLEIIETNGLRNIGLNNGGVWMPLNIPASVTTMGVACLADSRFSPLTSDASDFIMDGDILYDITGGGCKALQSLYNSASTVTFRTGTTHILDYCFSNSLRTGTLTFLSTITNINTGAFYSARAFTGALTLLNTVLSLGNAAFYYTRFTSVSIGTGLTSLPESVFADMRDVTGGLVIPNNITSIGNSAISNWYLATGTVTMSNAVVTFGYNVFWGSAFTGNLDIPASATSVGTNVCTTAGFTSITSSSTNYPVYDNVLYDIKTAGKVKVISSASGNTGTVTFRNDTTEIIDYGMYTCKRTGALTFPSTLTIIGQYSFRDCYYFSGTLTIPSTLLTIGTYAFYNCVGFWDSIIINNPTLTINGAYYPFPYCSNVGRTSGGVEVCANYASTFLNWGFSNYLSADTMNQSILNVTNGTAGAQKTITLGATNKARLLAAYPTAETDANTRNILIV